MKINRLLGVLAITACPFLVACSNQPNADTLTNGSQYEDSSTIDEVDINSESGVEEDSTQETENPLLTEPVKEVVPLTFQERVELRDELDKTNKVEDGEFYVPLPVVTEEVERSKVLAKTLYVTNNIAGFRFNEEDIDYYADYVLHINGQSSEPFDKSRLGDVNRLEEILGLCKATEINALVIDVKTDEGVVAWESDIEIVNRINSNEKRTIKDYDKLLSYLKDNDIYTIARIVAFKDPFFAQMEPDHAIQLVEGGVYKDGNGEAWVSSFDSYVWKYVVAVSKEAALRGFEEIQFDYIRFPDNAKKYNPITVFPGREGRDKDEGIEEFLQYANEELDDYDVLISADVFGQLTRSWDDHPEDIGQTWRKMANEVDYICPMLYPSHYGKNIYGFSVPDQFPYEVLKYSLEEAIERNAAQENPGLIRPWIQGFTASWVNGHISYGPFEISEQMRAAYELGIEEYIIWDSSNTYDPLIFFYHDRIGELLPIEGRDYMERTPDDAITRFLKAEKYNRYNQLYLLTPKANRNEQYDTFESELTNSEFILEDYEIHDIVKENEDKYIATVSGKYTSVSGYVDIDHQQYEIIREKGIFKVVRPDLEWINPDDLPIGLSPNEQGRIMVLMYHNIGETEATWVRTPENFIKDMTTLYEKGYRPLSLTDYVTGNITTEMGYTPVVITVDDANLNNFEYLEDGSIDPECMVGLLLAFNKEHPDFPLEVTFFADGQVPFSQRGLESQKVEFLIEKGMDIGNHTKNHDSMKLASKEEIQEYIGEQAKYLLTLTNKANYEVNTLSLPYGERPKDETLYQYLASGTYEEVKYENIAILNVGWNPAYSPYDTEKFNPLSIPRIRASEMDVDNVGMYNYIEYFDNHPENRFISDGE